MVAGSRGAWSDLQGSFACWRQAPCRFLLLPLPSWGQPEAERWLTSNIPSLGVWPSFPGWSQVQKAPFAGRWVAESHPCRSALVCESPLVTSQCTCGVRNNDSPCAPFSNGSWEVACMWCCHSGGVSTVQSPSWLKAEPVKNYLMQKALWDGVIKLITVEEEPLRLSWYSKEHILLW